MLQTEGRNYKLAKNQYEGYQYIDLDNFYTYENSFVLINKQNILDPNLAKNVYSWAGQYRKVNITKSGNPFMSIQSFSSAENFINDLLNTYHQKPIQKKV